MEGAVGTQLSESARSKQKPTPEKFLEKPLVESARKLLAQHYPFVASEFGVLLPQEAEWRYVDLVGAKWGQGILWSQAFLETAAVECKRARTVRASINAALGQATDYQLCFHKVFVATEDGKVPADKRELMKLLGIGHIVVDTVKDKATFSYQPTITWRFNMAAFERLAPRFVTALAFQEAFRDIAGDPRHGGQREGGIWLAKAVRENLQWNCWWDEAKRTTYCGINIERKSDIRTVSTSVPTEALQSALGKLPSEYRVKVTMDPVPGRLGAQDRTMMRDEARRINAQDLLVALRKILRRKKWRPHLSLYARAWADDEKLNRWEYSKRLQRIRGELSEVMTLFADCYGEG